MSDERTYKMLLSDIAGGGGSGGLPDYSEANDGDVLSIENGEPAWAAPGSGILVCTDTEGVLDKTWQEIYDAMNSSTLCVIFSSYSYPPQYGVYASIITNVERDGDSYSVVVNSPYALYVSESANGYPVYSD